MTQFRVKSASVIHETINDEAVIVNLDSGTYFSLDSAASFVWDALVVGHSTDAVATAAAAGYALDPAQAGEHVRALTEQLLQHDLLVEGTPPAPPPAPLTAPAARDAVFSGMGLHVYRDMEELLMLDPIHDVTEAGWPHTPPKP